MLKSLKISAITAFIAATAQADTPEIYRMLVDVETLQKEKQTLQLRPLFVSQVTCQRFSDIMFGEQVGIALDPDDSIINFIQINNKAAKKLDIAKITNASCMPFPDTSHP